MPVGLVNDDAFAKEIERLSGREQKKVSPQVIEIERAGRSVGDTNVPESLRKIIGEEALLNGRQAALSLAKDFGISPSSASAYANGSTSTTTYNTPNKNLIGHINESRKRAIKRAQKTLNGALGAITQEKLDYADPKDLASIAKDMTVVIKNLEPQEAANADANKPSTPQFVIFAPQFRQENSFESIVVNE